MKLSFSRRPPRVGQPDRPPAGETVTIPAEVDAVIEALREAAAKGNPSSERNIYSECGDLRRSSGTATAARTAVQRQRNVKPTARS
jgi:hypothetical protein